MDASGGGNNPAWSSELIGQEEVPLTPCPSPALGRRGLIPAEKDRPSLQGWDHRVSVTQGVALGSIRDGPLGRNAKP